MKYLLLLFLLVGCTGSTDLTPRQPTQQSLSDVQLVIFDVGHGQSALITNGTYDILFDCGGPKLNIEEIRSKVLDNIIEGIVLSNNDADHINKCDEVLRSFVVHSLYWNGVPHTTQTFSGLLNLTKEYPTLKIFELQQDFQIIEWVNVITPIDTHGVFTGSNNNALLLKAQTINKTFLLAGDCELECEQELLKTQLQDLQAGVLLVGHHGSKTSSSLLFLQAVNPSIAVISTDGERYGLPNQEIIERLSQFALVYRTDKQGTVIIS